MSGDDLAVADHARLGDDPDIPTADATPGVYRVVGTDADTVTLLRVADTDGRRRHTGELLTVDRDQLSAFEPADNPDGNRSPAAALIDALDGFGWQLRTVGRSLADRPLLSAVAGVVLVAGLVGEQFLSGPDWAFGLAAFAGSLTLAALGSNLF